MFSDPTKNIEQCNIQVGQDIADLGSGSGFYSISAARALHSTGRVYSIDINKDVLRKLKNTAVRDNLHNVEVIWGDIEKPNGTKLRDLSIDLALLCNIFFQISNKEDLIKEVKRILKPSGRVLVVDWSDSFGGIGPKPEVVVKKEVAMALFEKFGFHLEKEISAGSHHYGLIYKKL